MMRKLVIIGTIAVLAAASYGLWVYFKPHRAVKNEKAAYSISAAVLATEFTKDDSASHRKYFEQVVEISGRVTKVSDQDSLVMITIDPGDRFLVTCFLDKEEKARPLVHDSVLIKGLYVGYFPVDEDFGLPGDIKFGNCYVLN